MDCPNLHLIESGDLYMWGWNESGQLGLAANQSDLDDSVSCNGQIQCQAVPVPVDFPDDLDILTASCGARHTAAVAGRKFSSLACFIVCLFVFFFLEVLLQ